MRKWPTTWTLWHQHHCDHREHDLVTSADFIDQLRSYGCKIVFYVEYVRIDPGTEHLAFADEQVA